jgi:hypothetical protein
MTEGSHIVLEIGEVADGERCVRGRILEESHLGRRTTICIRHDPPPVVQPLVTSAVTRSNDVVLPLPAAAVGVYALERVLALLHLV